jgi:hypothetical protein
MQYFDIIVSTKSVYFKFRFGGGGGAAGLQPPLPLGAPMGTRSISSMSRMTKLTLTAFTTVSLYYHR